MKRLATFAALLLLLSIASLSRAHAASPDTSQPANAVYLNSLPQNIGANATQWYKFDYAGDKSDITITMPNGAYSNVAFNIFTPAGILDWWETKPIGRGTIIQIDCDTGDEDPGGKCQSDYLKWAGKFNAAGTYYAQVINYNPGRANFSLTIDGTGVSLGPSASSALTPSKPQQTVPVLPVTGGIWWDLLKPRPIPVIAKW